MLARSRTQFGERSCKITDATEIRGLEDDCAKEAVAAIGFDAKLAVTFEIP